jgi:hypothetical protein
MRRRVLLASAAFLTVLGILLVPSWAEGTKTPPVKTPLDVTYYFLPG